MKSKIQEHLESNKNSVSKKIVIIIGFISALLAVILAVTPLFKLALAPIIIAFVCGLIVLFLSKKQNSKTKIIQYIFLLVIMALSLTIYKGVVNPSEIENTKQKDEESVDENMEDSIEIIEETQTEDGF